MKKYLKLFCTILVVAAMTVCFAACGDDKGKTGTPTNVSGKTYVYVSASESSGMMTKDDLEELFGGAFKFETDGTITGVNVEDGSQSSHILSGSKWTQSGAKVSIKTGDGAEALTYSGSATGETLSLSAQNNGMNVRLNYKLYKAAGEESEDGEEPIVVTDKVEGTYKFYSYKIASVNSTYYVGDKIPGEDFTLTEDFYVVILKADNTGVMVSMGDSLDVTWSKNNNAFVLSMDNRPYSGTLVNRTATVTDDEGNVWTFKKYSDSTTLTPATPDMEKDISGCAFSFEKIEVIKKGTLTDADIKDMQKHLNDTHFVFEKGGKFIAVLGGHLMEGTWTQEGNKVTGTIKGEPQEFTIKETVLIVTNSANSVGQNYTVEAHYSYAPNYKYDDSSLGAVDMSTLSDKAFIFESMTLENVDGSPLDAKGEEVESILNEANTGAHFVFREDGTYYNVESNGTQMEAGTWAQKGSVVILEIRELDAEGEYVDGSLTFELINEGYHFYYSYSYDPDFKVPSGGSGSSSGSSGSESGDNSGDTGNPSGGNAGGEVNPNPSSSLNFGGTYVFGDIGQTDGAEDAAAYNAAMKKYSTYVFDFTANSSDSGVCALTTADSNVYGKLNYVMSGNIVSITGTLSDGSVFEATMAFDGEQLIWEFVEGNASYAVTLFKK